MGKCCSGLRFLLHLGWINGDYLSFVFLSFKITGAPVESELTLNAVCLNAPQQVCEPASAFWKLAVLSKSQSWVGIAVELG
jgi:hypothetical protein